MKKFNNLEELSSVLDQFPEKETGSQPKDYELLTSKEIRREFEIRQYRRRKSKNYAEIWMEIYSSLHNRCERIGDAREVPAIHGEQGGLPTYVVLKQSPTAEQVARFYYLPDPKKPKIVEKQEARIKRIREFESRIYTIGDGGREHYHGEYRNMEIALKQSKKLFEKNKSAYEDALVVYKLQQEEINKKNNEVVQFLKNVLR